MKQPQTNPLRKNKASPKSLPSGKQNKTRIAKPKNTLLDFFKKAPYPEVDLDIERKKTGDCRNRHSPA